MESASFWHRSRRPGIDLLLGSSRFQNAYLQRRRFGGYYVWQRLQVHRQIRVRKRSKQKTELTLETLAGIKKLNLEVKEGKVSRLSVNMGQAV
jgi:hypothetical protein